MSFDPEDLARDAELLQRLAHRLIPDPEAALDATQDVALAWLEKRPADVRNSRAWLVGALRMERFKWLGHRARRSQQETTPEQIDDRRPGADDPAVGELSDLIERETRALREPYASVVYSSLFEDRSLKEIARLLGRPHATVRSQHARGLEMLRERLDRVMGGRRAWSLLLLPSMGTRPTVAPGPTSTAAARSLRARHAWLTLSAATIGLMFWLNSSGADGGSDGMAERDRGPRETRLAESVTVPAGEVAALELSGRSAVAIPIERDEQPSPALVPSGHVRRLRIRAVDPQGTGLEGALVRGRSRIEDAALPTSAYSVDVPLARTDESGAAVVIFPADSVLPGSDGSLQSRFSLELPGYRATCYFTMTWDPDPARDDLLGESRLVLLEAPLDVEFRVFDEQGELLTDTEIAISYREPLLENTLVRGVQAAPVASLLMADYFQSPGDHDFARGWHEVTAWSPSRGLTVRNVDLQTSGPCEIRFSEKRAVRGRVLDSAGRPVAGAKVWYERATGYVVNPPNWCVTQTNALGEYELALGDPSSAQVWASHPDNLGEAVSRMYPDIPPGVSEGYDLQLGASRPIQVRLLDAEGHALVDWNIRLLVLESNQQIQIERNTDAQGRATFPDYRDSHLDLSVCGPQLGRYPARLRRRGFRPPLEEEVLVVEPVNPEPCAILGRILTPDGALPSSLSLLIGDSDSPAPDVVSLPATGEYFELEGYPPGPAQLSLMSSQYFLCLGGFVLPEGQFLDLGDIAIPAPGRVRLVPEVPGTLEATIVETRVLAFSTGRFTPHVLKLHRWPDETIELLPGEYSVTMLDRESKSITANFTVRSRETSVVKLRRPDPR